jgi:hypothetical protein
MNKNGDRNRHWTDSILDRAQLFFQLPQNQPPIPQAAPAFLLPSREFGRAVAPDWIWCHAALT